MSYVYVGDCGVIYGPFRDVSEAELEILKFHPYGEIVFDASYYTRNYRHDTGLGLREEVANGLDLRNDARPHVE